MAANDGDQVSQLEKQKQEIVQLAQLVSQLEKQKQEIVQLLRREISNLKKQNKKNVQWSQTMLERTNNEFDALNASWAEQQNDIDRLWEVIRQLNEQLNVSSKELDDYREQLKVQHEQLKVQHEQLENFERLLRDIRHTADLRELYIQTLLKQHEMMEAENKRRLDNLQMTRLDEHREYTSKITELNAENASLRSKLITQKEVKSAKTTLENKELQSSLPEIDTLKAALTSALTWLQQIGLL